MQIADIPSYHRRGIKNGSTYVIFGRVKTGGNEPYCYVEEKQCSKRICRILSPERVVDKAQVIRDDGTVWTVHLRNFEDWELIVLLDDD